jgi:CheY-like chemotaxis protein
MKQETGTQRRRFVLIDDDPTYRAVILRAAELEGLDLDVYESLMDLGSVGMLGRYDAAIVDYDLGNLNGVEIAEYLSALFGDIPMVLVSEKTRSPGEKGWPASIKSFVNKSQGYAFALKQAQRFAKSRVLPELAAA